MVKKMREIREQFSSEILDMTLEEQKIYTKKLIDKLKEKRKKAHNNS